MQRRYKCMSVCHHPFCISAPELPSPKQSSTFLLHHGDGHNLWSYILGKEKGCNMVARTTSEFKLGAMCLFTVSPTVKDILAAEMSEQSANPAVEGCVLTSLAQLSM